jgi:hypothetical protein
VDEGLVEEIDTSKLTHWDKVPDSFKKIGQINGKQYFLPWDWGFIILYRTDKIPKALTLAALMIPSSRVTFPRGRRPRRGHLSYIHGWDETKITPSSWLKEEWTAATIVLLPVSRSWWMPWPMATYGWPTPGRALTLLGSGAAVRRPQGRPQLVGRRRYSQGSRLHRR